MRVERQERVNSATVTSLIVWFPFRDPPLHAKSTSLSEQLAVRTVSLVSAKPQVQLCQLSCLLQNPDATKAKLISRMAKMGQPMLPFLTGVAGQHESSDSELEVEKLLNPSQTDFTVSVSQC